jgi:hypothetical protein
MADHNPLEAALAAALADPARQPGFEHALLSAEVYVSPSDGVPPDDAVLGVDRPFTLRGVTLSDGLTPTALFSSVERLRTAFGAEAPVMGIRGLHLLELMKHNGVALNPGAPPALILTPDDVEAILVDIRDARLGQGGGDATLTAPDREPVNLAARLREAVAVPEVSGAWLARADWTDGRPSGWFLDVRGATGIAHIRRRVTAAIVGLDFHGETMELSVGPDQPTDGVGLRLV